jgi:hypothetical protein
MSKESSDARWMAFCGSRLEALASVDVRGRAGAMGLALDPSGTKAIASFLGKEYLIGADGVTEASGENVTVSMRSVLAAYLASPDRGPGGGGGTGGYVPYGRLAGGRPGEAPVGVSPDSVFKPLGDRFGADHALFRKAALALGARDMGVGSSGAAGYLFEGLPRLPVRVDFHEADEEFPAEIRVLFGADALEVVPREALELLVMCLTVALLLEAGLISCPDDCQDSFG